MDIRTKVAIIGLIGVIGAAFIMALPHYLDIPTPTPTATPTPTSIIDTMDSTSGWETYKDEEGSSINIKSVPGRTGNAIEISFDLKERGYVQIHKKLILKYYLEKREYFFFIKVVVSLIHLNLY